MASYTMELRNYIEQATQHIEVMPHRERIEEGRKKLFDFPYPFFDSTYKKQFETNFIRNFYMREIGQETEELFKMRLENWLMINMPYFNKLFESEKIKYDPLTNVKNTLDSNRKKDMEQDDKRNRKGSTREDEGLSQQSTSDQESRFKTDETGNVERTLDRTQKQDGSSQSETDSTSTEKNKGTSNETAFNRTLDDDRPDKRTSITAQDGVGIINYAKEIKEGRTKNDGSTTNDTDTTQSSETSGTTSDNLTGKDTEKTNSRTNTTGDSSSNQDDTMSSDRDLLRNTTDDETLDRDVSELEDYIQNHYGKIGTVMYQEMVLKQRETFIRIERDMFKEMDRLFMQVY